MIPYYEDRGLRIWHGANLAILGADALGYPFEFGYHSDRLIPDGFYDSIVTDPPYELGFMGKGWDSSGIAYSVDVWREALRVLKPGGHLLAFGGTRTYHRVACAIEDAGFEIRDSIAWLYGSGFPKSMNVAAAIDKVRDDSADVRVVCRWLRARIEQHPTLTVKSIAASFGFHPRMVEHWAARDTDSQPSMPTLEQWDLLRNALGFSSEMDSEVYRLNTRKGEPGEAWAGRDIVGEVEEWKDRTNYALTSRDGLKRGSTNNPVAAQWEGWGTALKPALEPIVVARKPLVGTVAANVLAYGTGALNIDATRIETTDDLNGGAYTKAGARAVSGSLNPSGMNRPGATANRDFTPPPGRWPSNVVLSHVPLLDEHGEPIGDACADGCVEGCPVAALDAQSGVLSSGVMRAGTRAKSSGGDIYGKRGEFITSGATYGDSGGASRFFPVFRYEAKAPTSERPNVDGTVHATVKPLALMQWLVRLVTRPGGRVGDIYAGSGTTGEAALLEGMQCDLFELEADHLPLILARVRKPLQPSLFSNIEGAA
jgi:hypothetical protein